MGHLNDDVTLSLLYSAADVMVIPSRQDNLPQTGVEAQSCGCPLVTFDCSGLPDLLEHKHTGYLAKAFDVDELAYGIEWVLADPDRYRELSRQSRDRSLRHWAPAVVVPQYLEVYRCVIDQQAVGR
jgi:glycosyltransferase involved in cell wall biosynthesis